MVSLRCKLLVHNELDSLGIPHLVVELGSVQLTQDISKEKENELKAVLQKNGLELIKENRAILIEKIKHSVVEMIHYADELPRTKFSNYLSEKLGYNYNYLAAIFIEVQGITIQQYIILHKTERAKELILYDELTLNEIAEKLHYSSVAHFSAQFKK